MRMSALPKADRTQHQLRALAADLLSRRAVVLLAWRVAGVDDGERSIAPSLSRAQFNDHIPAVLDCLAHTIEAWPDAQSAGADRNEHAKVCAHGLQRWQQGY